MIFFNNSIQGEYVVESLKRDFSFSFSDLSLAKLSKCLVSLMIHYTLNDSPHPQRSVSLGFLNTN